MLNTKLVAVLEVLHSLKPLSIEATQTKIEKIFSKISRRLIYIMVVCFLSLPILLTGTAVFSEASDQLIFIAKISYVILLGSSLVWIFTEIFPSILWLSSFKDETHQRRKKEIIHDLENVDRLQQHDLPALNVAERWLSLRIERMRLHVGFFTGGSDKVAVIALIVGGWGIWSNFPSNEATGQQYIYAAFSAFLGGMGIGGMLASMVIKQLCYQRDIILIALGNRAINTQ